MKRETARQFGGPVKGATGGYNVSIPADAKTITKQQEVAQNQIATVTTAFAYEENGEQLYYGWNESMNAYYSYSRNEVYGGDGVALTNGYMNTAWGTNWGSDQQPGYAQGLVFGNFQNGVNNISTAASLTQLSYSGIKWGLGRYINYRLAIHLDYAMNNYVLTNRQAYRLTLTPSLESAFVGERIDNLFKQRVNNDIWLKPFVNVTPRFRFGPDTYNRTFMLWWDVTTKDEWLKHTTKYNLQFGLGKGLYWK